MKTSARFLAMLLAVLMVASAALTASAFTDVNSSVEHSTAIGVLSQLGVIGGYEDGSFKPEQNVTRAEMAKLAYVLYTTFQKAGNGATAFTDVAADFWGAGYINWCSNKGIIGGYGDGKFGPNDNVTYDQALKMVCGVLGYTEWDSALWPVDVRQKALRDLDLGENMPETVKGEDKLTRAQVAQIMYNALTVEMNEKKTIDGPNIGGFIIPVEVPKTLAVDIWKFNECVYVIDDVNDTNDTVDVTLISVNGTAKAELAAEVEYPAEGDYDLEELGLEAFDGKLADIEGLYFTLIAEDDEILAKATINGSVIDNVEITYAKDEKSITVNGTKYTAKSEDIPAGIEFGSDNKIDADLKALLDKAYFARVIDFEGDGEDDAVIVTTKTAYEVTSITTKSNVKYLNYKKVDGTGTTLSTPVADVSVALEKGDVFVGAKIGVTLYAEKVEAVETYPTKIGTKTVTLKDAGTVDYKDIKVLGAQVINSINSDYLVDKKVEAYYIYNGQIIKTDATANSNSYNFVILKDIEADEEGFDEATMEAGTAYTATLVIDGEEKKVSLGSVKVNGSTMSLADAVTAYGHDDTGAKRLYKYAIVADYEVEDDVYALEIAKDLGDEYTVVPAGAKIKYNATTGLYTIDADGNTDTTSDVITKVVLDETSKIFYRYEKSTLAGFFYLGSYTKDTITAKSFNYAPTWGETYLVYDETAKTYTLLATIMTNKIEGIADDVVSYENDGRLILFAPEDSSTEPVEDELYYSHIFMDNATFENVESINKETTVEDGAVATEAGYLYGWVPADEVYEKITAADSLTTVKRATLNDVLTSMNLIDYAVAGTDYAAKVASSVTIWGLANDADEAAEYKQFTLDELAEMVELIDARTEEITDNKTALTAQKAELDPVEDAEEIEAIDAEIEAINAELAEIATIDMLMLYYEDANDDLVLATIIVEVFEADSEDVVNSVNDTIFVNYDYIPTEA